MYDPDTVIRAIRQAVHDQSSDFVNKQAFEYAQQEGLVKVSLWPAFVIHITDRGRNYIRGHQENQNEN